MLVMVVSVVKWCSERRLSSTSIRTLVCVVIWISFPTWGHFEIEERTDTFVKAYRIFHVAQKLTDPSITWTLFPGRTSLSHHRVGRIWKLNSLVPLVVSPCPSSVSPPPSHSCWKFEICCTVQVFSPKLLPPGGKLSSFLLFFSVLYIPAASFNLCSVHKCFVVKRVE